MLMHLEEVAPVSLVLKSGIVIDGTPAAPDDLVEVTQPEAANLLRRDKARLATEEDFEPEE